MGLISSILYINDHLVNIVSQFGNYTYLVLFAIIFIETGLVIFPFLPSDSLIFAAGAIAANTKYGLDIWLVYLVVVITAILGGNASYEVGAWSTGTGSEHTWFNELVNGKNRYATEKFFERHGSITIVIGRFTPPIRTFVPFVSGGSKVHYGHFITYNILGDILWIELLSIMGYFSENLPIVKTHFLLIVITIILVSVVPITVVTLKKKITLKGEFH